MLALTRISPVSIVLGHIETFRREDNKKFSPFEILFFVFILGVTSFFGYVYLHTIDNDTNSALISFYSIVGGFLVSTLFVIISFGSSLDENPKELPSSEIDGARHLQSQIFSNVSFGVVVAFSSAAICVIDILFNADQILAAITSCLFIIFNHTLLMVLKRIDSLFRKNYF